MPENTGPISDLGHLLPPGGIAPTGPVRGAVAPPEETAPGKDVGRVMSGFPAWGRYEGGPGCGCHGKAVERPFGLPPGPVTAKALASRAALLASLLPQLTAMLKELGKAHLAGTLTPGDLCVYQSLQDWYSRLQAELDALKLRR
jgi:hypothetical protein